MIQKIAHRGASGYEPENTLSAFKKALDLNVDMIELDIYVCKSGEVVVIHDKKINKLTNINGFINNFTYSEIKKFLVKGKEKIPLLTDVLDLINRKAKINIEIKDKKAVKPLAEIINFYVKQKDWDYDYFLISSSNYYILKRSQKLLPYVKKAFIIYKTPLKRINDFNELNTYSVNLSIAKATPEVINEFKKRGFKVFVWTVNSLKDIKKLRECNIDGIFSDYPDMIKISDFIDST